MSAMKLLVNACLLGACCRYDQKTAPDVTVISLGKVHQLIPVCPEQLGGLATPRVPAEIKGDRVINKDGVDVTENYICGAEQTLMLAKQLGCHAAVLKDRSPSCGCGEIYDGSFSGTKIIGNGITARLLIQNGIAVIKASEASSLML